MRSSLAQWVKHPALSLVKDLAVALVTPMAWVPSLAWELPYVAGVAKKNKISI